MLLLYQYSSSGTLSRAACKRRVAFSAAQVDRVGVMGCVLVCALGCALLGLQMTEYAADALNAFPRYIFFIHRIRIRLVPRFVLLNFDAFLFGRCFFL